MTMNMLYGHRKFKSSTPAIELVMVSYCTAHRDVTERNILAFREDYTYDDNIFSSTQGRHSWNDQLCNFQAQGYVCKSPQKPVTSTTIVPGCPPVSHVIFVFVSEELHGIIDLNFRLVVKNCL